MIPIEYDVQIHIVSRITDLAGDDFADALLSGAMIAKKPEPTAAQDDQARFKKQIENLTALKPVLDGTSFVVAYRFANEYALYESALESTLDPEKNEITKIKDGLSDDEKAKLPAQPVAFDDMVLMKVLPRISGDEAEVKKLFYGESGKLSDPKDNTLVKLLGPSNDTGSVRKIKSILERGGSYLSFWP